MLRDPSLIPLSRQHQHALALCVQIDRSIEVGNVDVNAWQREIELHYLQEIKFHFAAEEQVLFPAASRRPELESLVKELRPEHDSLRGLFAKAANRGMSQSDLGEFTRLLSSHIRKEERQLFEAMQKVLPVEEMGDLGRLLERSLEDATQACTLPRGATTSGG